MYGLKKSRIETNGDRKLAIELTRLDKARKKLKKSKSEALKRFIEIKGLLN